MTRPLPAHHRRPPDRSAPHHALTLAEVLIAMGLLSLGLLGVAAIFPVGGFYMQAGDTADRANAIAQAALEDAIIRGHLDPRNWVVHSITQGSGFTDLLTGQTEAVNPAPMPGLSTPTPVPAPAVFGVGSQSPSEWRSRVFGGAYVIDPIGIGSIMFGATNISDVINPQTSATVRRFPAFVRWAHVAPQWQPWFANGAVWPVRRVSTVHPAAALNNQNVFDLQRPIANALFQAADDLALELPADGDRPALQRYDAWNNDLPSIRQPAGDYSWLLTVAPESAEARDSLPRRPDAYPVEVSAVVFRKRAVGRSGREVRENERLVRARVLTAGPGGAELVLTRRESEGADLPSNDRIGSGPFEELREGEFVMLVGPHPLSTNSNPSLGIEADPRVALRWCRVLTIEGDRGGNEVIVAIRGPDLPWQAANSSDPSALSNDLRLAIVPGAVAVHTQTMRLEAGSEWSFD